MQLYVFSPRKDQLKVDRDQGIISGKNKKEPNENTTKKPDGFY